MGEEFALLNDLAAEQAQGVFEEIWDLISCRLHAPMYPTAAMRNISKRQQKV